MLRWLGRVEFGGVNYARVGDRVEQARLSLLDYRQGHITLGRVGKSTNYYSTNYYRQAKEGP